MTVPRPKPDDATPARDARHAQRRRAYLSGTIVSRDGINSCHCAIRELSEQGARVELPRATIFPPKLFLLTSRQAVAFEAQIIWRNATQAGLKLGATHRLSSRMHPDLLHLWRLFLELCPRGSDNSE